VHKDLTLNEFNLLLDNFNGMIYKCLFDKHWTMVFLSEGCYKLTGYSPHQLINNNLTPYSELIVEEHREYVYQVNLQAITSKQNFDLEYLIKHANGQLVWVKEHSVPVFDEAGEIQYIQGYIQDITQSKAAEKLLRDTEMRYRSIFENSIDGIFQTSPEGKYLAANKSLADIYGYSNCDALIHGMHDIECQLYVEHFRREQFIHEMDLNGSVTDFESQVYRKDKSIIWISESARKVYDGSGSLLYYEGTVRDITEHKRAEYEVEFHAMHDSLTGLPNRYYFNQKLQQGIDRCQIEHAKLAVIFLGIDHFRLINDSMGLEVGDQLLIAMGERISDNIREVDFVARLSGDEFAILLANVDHVEDIRYIDDFEVNIQRIMSAFSMPFVINNLDYVVSCSIGMSVYPHHGETASKLLKRSDIALQEAKRAGRKTYKIYNQLLGKAQDDRLQMEYNLRLAIESNEFLLHYQPKVSFDNNQAVGAEALLRWQPKNGPIVPPLSFIEIAEHSGLIVAIGGWVLREACRKTHEWNIKFGIRNTIAVNVSHVQFRQEGFLASVEAALQETGLPPSLLELEITESLAASDVETFIEKLHLLKSIGVNLAIDDFGTGYSSLTYLKDFPIDSLKIDQAFVRKLEKEPANAAILKAIVVLGQSLNMKVVAEGVETEYQKAYLRALGCDLYQGYLFSKPVSEQAYEELLAVNNVS
jgi:diguanylate cyclase (GGDEF)-like protein/PAS domain S-box-containing protein